MRSRIPYIYHDLYLSHWWRKLNSSLECMSSLGVLAKAKQPTELCAPMVIVPKKDVRIWADFTQLSKYVKCEVFPTMGKSLSRLSFLTTGRKHRSQKSLSTLPHFEHVLDNSITANYLLGCPLRPRYFVEKWVEYWWHWRCGSMYGQYFSIGADEWEHNSDWHLYYGVYRIDIIKL